MEMDGKMLVAQLVKGSLEIDRMKKEIDLVVRLVLESIHFFPADMSRIDIPAGSGFWRIISQEYKLIASYWGEGPRFLYCSAGNHQPPLVYVQQVHAALGGFVIGMEKHFDLYLEPFLAVARS